MNWLHIKQYLTEGPQSVHVHRCPQGRNTTETRLILHFRQYTDFRSCAFSFSATSSWGSVSTIRNNTVDFMSFISNGIHRCNIKQLLTFLFLYFALLHNSILYVENQRKQFRSGKGRIVLNRKKKSINLNHLNLIPLDTLRKRYQNRTQRSHKIYTDKEKSVTSLLSNLRFFCGKEQGLFAPFLYCSHFEVNFPRLDCSTSRYQTLQKIESNIYF